MKNITKENYFSVNNGALTNSKIKDYLLDKNYFYRKHILGEIEQKKSKAFLIGDVTDSLLTDIDTKNYAVCQFDGRTKDGKEERARYEAEGKIVISQQEYDEIMEIADAVLNTTAYQQLSDFVKQEIVQIPLDGGEYFQILAGKPDFYKVYEDRIVIVDLKTTTDINETKYHYRAMDYGYYQQAAIYSHILRQIYKIDKVDFYHLAVAKIKDIYPVGVFKLNEQRINMVLKNILENVIPSIKEEKEFKKYNPSLSDFTEIGELVDMW